MLAAPRRAFLALVLVVLTLVSGGCGITASPERGSSLDRNLSATPPSGALQEVAPPGAVQQLNERLNDRSPQVKVIAPADQALLPAGPWSLKLQVNDWPLADAGSLGLGPHLVVQLDDQEPLRISSAEAAANVTMPDLRPGSHRITVYAARPWGEAVKAPGASAQIRALAHYGVTARLVQNADFKLLEQQINRGIPVPCGYIHRGAVERPAGGGHWLIVYGHTPTHVVVNDPWGEPDLVHGTTLNTKGMGLGFSRLNFGKRWMVEPIGGGAYRYAPGKGWAVVVERANQ